MENTEHVTEGDPLKTCGDEAEAGTEQKKKGWKEALGLSKLTHWRTAVFFLSLFVCLTIVFAFSFVIPCPERPQYLASWNKTFPEAATYDFLAIELASDDKVMDILLVFKSAEGTQNKSCADSGLPSPCVFLSAVAGTDGETLWESPLAAEYHWAQCGLQEETRRSWDCLLSHADQLTALDKRKGTVIWQQPHPTGMHSSVPVLSLPDLDGDKVGDVALMASDSSQTQLVLLSGATGDQIGSTVVLDSNSNHLLHLTAEGSHYVLLQKDTGLYALALWRIAARAKAGMEAGLKPDKHLEQRAIATSGLVPIIESHSVRQVLRTEEGVESSRLLVVTGWEVAMVEGKELRLQWRYNSSAVFGVPSFGHFNKDELLDVMVEEDIGNNTKRVIILDGKSGDILWEVNLLASPNSPRPASIHTTNLVSIFMFWGLLASNPNASVTDDRHSYMLHPLYSKVLLESTNVLDHIITFRATLMERGRHAAYILLTGPASEGAEGTVVLSKRKLKQDVSHSNVRPVGSGCGASETDDDIKEAFNRLRFSDS